MNIFTLMLFLLKIFSILSQSQYQLEKISKYAKAYNQLMKTFDVEEYPLNEYYCTEKGKKLVDEFGMEIHTILKLIDEDLELKSIELEKRRHLFYKFIQEDNANLDPNKKPYSYSFLKFFRNSQLSRNDRNNLCFKYDMETSDEKIINTLKNYEKISINKNEKSARSEYMHINFINTKLRIGDKSIPITTPKFSNHHIIPFAVLKQFWTNYEIIENIVANQNNGKYKFDYDNVFNHNQRKYYIFDNRRLAELNSEDGLCPEFFKLEHKNNYENFMGRILFNPVGFLFRGPNTRWDDPNPDKVTVTIPKMEPETSITIVGEYKYNIFKEIFDKMQQFNNDFEKTKSNNEKIELKQKAYEINTLLLSSTTYEQLYPWNPRQWFFEEKTIKRKPVRKWRIKSPEEFQKDPNRITENISPVMYMTEDGKFYDSDGYTYILQEDGTFRKEYKSENFAVNEGAGSSGLKKETTTESQVCHINSCGRKFAIADFSAICTVTSYDFYIPKMSSDPEYKNVTRWRNNFEKLESYQNTNRIGSKKYYNFLNTLINLKKQGTKFNFI